MAKKKEPYKLPSDRHRFGGIMGDVEKRVVTLLGGPTKALSYLVMFYIKHRDKEEQDRRDLEEQVKRLERLK